MKIMSYESQLQEQEVLSWKREDFKALCVQACTCVCVCMSVCTSVHMCVKILSNIHTHE